MKGNDMYKNIKELFEDEDPYNELPCYDEWVIANKEYRNVKRNRFIIRIRDIRRSNGKS